MAEKIEDLHPKVFNKNYKFDNDCSDGVEKNLIDRLLTNNDDTILKGDIAKSPKQNQRAAFLDRVEES